VINYVHTGGRYFFTVKQSISKHGNNMVIEESKRNGIFELKEEQSGKYMIIFGWM
jgi:hypothetical protein